MIRNIFLSQDPPRRHPVPPLRRLPPARRRRRRGGAVRPGAPGAGAARRRRRRRRGSPLHRRQLEVRDECIHSTVDAKSKCSFDTSTFQINCRIRARTLETAGSPEKEDGGGGGGGGSAKGDPAAGKSKKKKKPNFVFSLHPDAGAMGKIVKFVKLYSCNLDKISIFFQGDAFLDLVKFFEWEEVNLVQFLRGERQFF